MSKRFYSSINITSGNTLTVSDSLTAGNIAVTSNITSANVAVGALTAGNLRVPGTLTVTNISVNNLVQSSGSITVTGNSNTIGNIFTTGGNVGIGTTAPNSKLHVYDNTNGGVNMGVYNGSTSGNAYSILSVGNDTGYNLSIFLNSSSRTIDGGTRTATIRNDGGGLRLLNSNHQGMTIDGTTGNVSLTSALSMPNITSFYAYSAVIGTIIGPNSSQSKIPFSSTSLNNGSCYNTSTYTFTVPRNGIYFFLCNCHCFGNGGGINISMMKNNNSTLLSRTAINTSDSPLIKQNTGPSCINYFTAGDTVYIIADTNAAGYIWGDSFSFFQGWQIG